MADAGTGVIGSHGAKTFRGLVQLTGGVIGIDANGRPGDPATRINMGSSLSAVSLGMNSPGIDLSRPLALRGNATLNAYGFDAGVSDSIFDNGTSCYRIIVFSKLLTSLGKTIALAGRQWLWALRG